MQSIGTLFINLSIPLIFLKKGEREERADLFTNQAGKTMFSNEFLAKECAQYWLIAWRTKPAQ